MKLSSSCIRGGAWSWVFAVVALGLASCESDEERPPILAPTGGVDNPVSCDGLREVEPEPNEAGRFFVSGGVADCVSDGQWCPTNWVTSLCDAGLPFAQCLLGEWVVSCEELGEAGSDGA